MRRLGGKEGVARAPLCVHADLLPPLTHTTCERLPRRPPPPPSPPPAPRQAQGGALSWVRSLRGLLGLAPFTVNPSTVSLDYPYGWQAQGLAYEFSSGTTGSYALNATACQAGFQASNFEGRRMEARTEPPPQQGANGTSFHVVSRRPQAYDSCYLTQTKVRSPRGTFAPDWRSKQASKQQEFL